jgi:cytochrome P450
MRGTIPTASLWENLVYNLCYLIPTSLQGTFTRNRFWVGFWTRVHPDPAVVRFVGRLRRKYRSDAIYLRMLTTPTLLLLGRDAVRWVLAYSPDQYIGAKAKRDGLSHFQPDAVTISRGEEWADRRRFNEAVLDYGRLHRYADRFLVVVRDEIAPTSWPAPSLATWDDFDGLFARVTRRIIFGDAAAGDMEVTDWLRKMMRESNNPFAHTKSRYFDPFYQRIRKYLGDAEPGSLAALCKQTPSDAETRVENQVPHWMFAMWETLGTNTLRALALILAHPVAEQHVRWEMAKADLATAAGVDGLKYLEGCVQEAMRLWPTTPMLVRETVVQSLICGQAVPVGTQVLILNSVNHRDRKRYAWADSFAPERWAQGTPDSLFNHLSSGRQVCAGKDLALFLAKAVLATLLASRRLVLAGPKLDPSRPMPYAYDYFNIRFEAAASDSRPLPAGTVAPTGGPIP